MLDPYLIQLKKKITKTKDLTVRSETMKVLKGNMEENLHEIGFGDDFLDMTPKVQETKEKIKRTSSKF